MPVSTAQKRAEFRKLHESGCFVLPNPWDVGSAQLLQGMGFKALASTSSGFAWSIALFSMADCIDAGSDFIGGKGGKKVSADVIERTCGCCCKVLLIRQTTSIRPRSLRLHSGGNVMSTSIGTSGPRFSSSHR